MHKGYEQKFHRKGKFNGQYTFKMNFHFINIQKIQIKITSFFFFCKPPPQTSE